jgi:hypothetical protein
MSHGPTPPKSTHLAHPRACWDPTGCWVLPRCQVGSGHKSIRVRLHVSPVCRSPARPNDEWAPSTVLLPRAQPPLRFPRNHLWTEGKGLHNIVSGIGLYIAGNSSPKSWLALKPYHVITRRLDAITVGEYTSSVFVRPSSSFSASRIKVWCSESPGRKSSPAWFDL